jgi:hypothetical protein
MFAWTMNRQLGPIGIFSGFPLGGLGSSTLQKSIQSCCTGHGEPTHSKLQ